MSLGRAIDLNIHGGESVADAASAAGLREVTTGDLHLLVVFGLEGTRRRRPTATDPTGTAPTGTAPTDHDGPAASHAGADGSRANAGPSDVDTATDSVEREPGASLDTAVGTSQFDETANIESLVSYLELDFFEHELFAREFLPTEDEVRYTSRGIGDYQLLCVYDEEQGLLVVLDNGEPIRPVVEGARSVLADD